MILEILFFISLLSLKDFSFKKIFCTNKFFENFTFKKINSKSRNILPELHKHKKKITILKENEGGASGGFFPQDAFTESDDNTDIKSKNYKSKESDSCSSDSTFLSKETTIEMLKNNIAILEKLLENKNIEIIKIFKYQILKILEKIKYLFEKKFKIQKLNEIVVRVILTIKPFKKREIVSEIEKKKLNDTFITTFNDVEALMYKNLCKKSSSSMIHI